MTCYRRIVLSIFLKLIHTDDFCHQWAKEVLESQYFWILITFHELELKNCTIGKWGMLRRERRHWRFFLLCEWVKSLGPFTVLTVSHGVAHFHTSAVGITQRFHLYHQHDVMQHMTAPEFNYVDLSRPALRCLTPNDAVKRVNQAFLEYSYVQVV